MIAPRIALLATILAQPLWAQIVAPRQPRLRDQWVFGGDVFGGIPVGEFRKHEDGGAGGEVMVGFQLWRRQPAVFRMQVGSLAYGTVHGRAYQQVCDAFSCWTEQVTYNARSHTMTYLQAGPEFMATDGLWRPYGYALGGYTFFNSSANLLPTSPTDPQGTRSVRLFSSHNFSTTYGAGVRRSGRAFGRPIALDLGADVIRNAKARYLTEQGLTRNGDGSWTVTPRSGAANVLKIRIGLWIGPYRNWNE